MTTSFKQFLTEEAAAPYALNIARLMTPASRDEALSAIARIRDKYGAEFSTLVWKLAKKYRAGSTELRTHDDNAPLYPAHAFGRKGNSEDEEQYPDMGELE